jgi:succinate dehydrogenase/fumarate reductase flavoprotein subunit
VRKAPSIRVLENHRVTDLALDGHGAVAGVVCVPGRSEGSDEPVLIPGRAVVLATGGIGGALRIHHQSSRRPGGRVGAGSPSRGCSARS